MESYYQRKDGVAGGLHARAHQSRYRCERWINQVVKTALYLLGYVAHIPEKICTQRVEVRESANKIL